MFSAVGVLVPPAIEPVSIDMLRRHIRVDADDEDDLIAIYLTAARSMVEQFLGRVLITQTLRWISARTPPLNAFPLFPFTAFILPLWMPYSQLFHRPIELPRAPVQSVSAVSYGTWGAPDTALTTSQFNVDAQIEPARLLLLQGAGSFPSDHLVVDFVAGYGDAAANIPTPIIVAIMMLAAYLYENRGDVETEMPEATKALLWPYRLYSFAG